jgi:2-polyprenyl-3-methyl-5-hydroxy-6-metoxy-1,4-benzoquinol methylase
MVATRKLAVEQLTACPVCQDERAELVLTQPDGYLPELRLHRCRQCQTVFLSPRLTLDAIVAVEDESEVYSFDREVAEEWITGGLTSVIAHLEGYVPTASRCLLDIGCNRGLLMEAARRRGWQVTGVEIAGEAANRARRDYGHTVYATLDAVGPGAQFDLITAWHVLEHTLNPLEFLRQVASLLIPGGILAVQVPAYEYLEEYRRREQVGSLLSAVHNFYFTRTNLKPVLVCAGLHVQQIDLDPKLLLLTAICKLPAARPSWQRLFGRWLGRTT